jgi:hypothetical protein
MKKMTPIELNQYFDYHNSNIRLLKIGFEHIRNQIKDLYHKQDKNGNYIFNLSDSDINKIEAKKIEKSLSRILSGIQVSWAEESIKRLLYETNLFTDVQRNFIITKGALDQKWYQSLKIVFCIAYDLVPIGDETCDSVNIKRERGNLGNELVNQYFELRELITNHFVPNFSIRNKVQHGEWEYAFKPKHSAEYSQEITDSLNSENIVTTTSRFTLVNAFYQMVVDLGRFKSNSFALDSIKTPFEFFYVGYMRKIRFEISKINSPDLESFISEIIDKEKRGRVYRQQNSAN